MWNPVSSILVKTDWQYTEPITGEYFRLKHTNAPLNSSYLIAQAQVNTNNSIELLDITELKVTPELQDVYLKKPGIFSDRRIAIKRLSKQPTLESELRRVIRDDLFRDSDFGELSARRVAWTVDIEVSDYVAPVPSSGEPTPPNQPPSVSLVYSSDGDTNGLFYYLGTDKKTVAFTNPAVSGKVIITANSQASGYTPHNLVGRDASIYASGTASVQFFKIDLKESYTLALNHYTLLGRNDYNGNHPRNWKFQGSNDDIAWTDLDEQINNTNINVNSYFSKALNVQSIDYRYFRLITTGVDSNGSGGLIMSEIELYGTLKG